MFTLCRALWTDESGFIISTELVLIATVGVIGLTAGLACLRDSVVGELTDVGNAIGSLNQSYCYTGFSAASPQCCKSRTFGSCFTDHQEGGVVSRVDVQGETKIRPTPAPRRRHVEEHHHHEHHKKERRHHHERAVEERVIRAPGVEVEEEIVCPPATKAGAAVQQLETPVCSGKTVGECESCSSAVGSQSDGCRSNEPRPVHAIEDRCGEVLHYSETRGEPVRLIDPVDAIHTPNVKPRLALW